MQLAFDTPESVSGPPIVLLHGLTGSRERYSHLAAWLESRDYHVLNIDLRGHGESPWAETYRAGDYASDVAGLIDTQRIGPAVVVGHSLGGVVALKLAAHRSNAVKALFLEDPAVYTDSTAAPDEFVKFVEQIRAWQERGVTEAVLIAELGQWPSAHPNRNVQDVLNPVQLARLARGLLAFDPAAADAAISGESWEGFDPKAPVRCPVTVLRADPSLGAAFPLEHSERYVVDVPQARIVLAEGSSHSILTDPIGHPQYMSTFDDFIRSLEQ